MSNVIVLSDSDESISLSPVADEKIESEIGGKYLDASNDFDFPEVPFCREIADSPTSQGDSNLNVDNGYKHTEKSSSSDSENRVNKISRKATVSKKDKAMLKEERSRRQQALAREKTLKAIEKKTLKDMKPGECIKFMEVYLDRSIDSVASREEIENTLQNAGIKFNVTTEKIPNSITWRRNIEEDYIGEDNDVRTRRSIQMEEYAIVIWSNYKAVKHVAEGTFCTSVSDYKDLIPNYNMTLVICGMEEYFAYRKKQKSDRNPGNKGSRYNGKEKRES